MDALKEWSLCVRSHPLFWLLPLSVFVTVVVYMLHGGERESRIGDILFLYFNFANALMLFIIHLADQAETNAEKK
jgi:uncharacterized membrane protein YwaF